MRECNSVVSELYLSYNEIDDECMKQLGEYIKSNESIEVIWLSSNKMSDAGIKIFAPYLDGNTTFKELNLNNNKTIADASVPLLLKMIESSHIVNMDISSTSITQENIIDVYASLICNRIKNGSTKLDLSVK